MQVHADSDYQRVRCGPVRHQLGQDASQLAAVNANIVWPLELHRQAVRGKTVSQRDTARQCNRRQRLRTDTDGDRGRKQQRMIGRRAPQSLPAATPAGLKRSSAQQRARRLPHPGLLHQIFIGRARDGHGFNRTVAATSECQSPGNVGRVERSRTKRIRGLHQSDPCSQAVASGCVVELIVEESTEFSIGPVVRTRACQRVGTRPTIPR